VKLLLMASIGLQINEAFFFDIDLDFHGTLLKGDKLACSKWSIFFPK
jgi:hypothetical protein